MELEGEAAQVPRKEGLGGGPSRQGATGAEALRQEGARDALEPTGEGTTGAAGSRGQGKRLQSKTWACQTLTRRSGLSQPIGSYRKVLGSRCDQLPFSANAPGCCEEQQECWEASKDPRGGDNAGDWGLGDEKWLGWGGSICL